MAQPNVFPLSLTHTLVVVLILHLSHQALHLPVGTSIT